jgi:DNA uptake protein ComE-like DNA-binding protein
MRNLFAVLLCLGLTGSALAASDKPAGPAATQVAPVDINRASVDELKALKGVGEARAAAIVKGRPYGRKDDLVRRGIIPESVYNEIREQIVAKQ